MRKRNTASLDRRSFLAAAMSAALAGKILAEQSSKIYTAAIIGHTGHGDYGHSVDQIFTNRDDVQLLAVADPVAEGRAKAMQRSKALRQYENYREMLAEEKPQLVGIAPRWTDQRRGMCLSAGGACAPLCTAKPLFTQSIEGSEILSSARQTN